MTILLKKAVEQLKALPQKRQDSYAVIILEELYGELGWDKLFAGTTSTKVQKLEKAVLEDIKNGAKPLSRFLKNK